MVKENSLMQPAHRDVQHVKPGITLITSVVVDCPNPYWEARARMWDIYELMLYFKIKLHITFQINGKLFVFGIYAVGYISQICRSLILLKFCF